MQLKRPHDMQCALCSDCVDASACVVAVQVSNNGARIRWLLYKCGLENEVDIQPPKVLGEHKLQLNPTGKIPMLVLPDGSCLPESEVRAHLHAWSSL